MPDTTVVSLTSVRDRSHVIATFRHISVRLMEIVAGWTPSTPEMEAKLLFGRQIWDFAQMADALGKRVFEMRQPLHYTRKPVQQYDDLLEEIAGLSATSDRLDGLGVLQWGLEKRLVYYWSRVDPILDQPSTVIMDDMVRALQRQRRDGDALRQVLGVVAGPLAADLGDRESSIEPLVHQSALA